MTENERNAKAYDLFTRFVGHCVNQGLLDPALVGIAVKQDEVDGKKKITRFVAPTVAEVAAYCKERNNGIDAQAFVDHYESNGWKVGKNPMKKWQAAVRTWERSRADAGYGRPAAKAVSPERQKEIDADLRASERAAHYENWKQTL